MVLAIMVLPTVAAVSQDALRLVPYRVKEAAYGMGATRWEAILKVMLPAASTGIFGALVLGFGRALGETMALAMLIGNSNQISLSLFSPANTLAALLALNFPGSGAARGAGADVRRAGPARHHPRGQRDRGGHHDALRAPGGSAAVSDARRSRAVDERRRVAAPADELERSSFEPRALQSLLLTIGAWAAAIIAAVPLVSVLYMLIVRGGSRLSWELFTELPPAGFEMGGGFGNAIVGTVVVVGIAGLHQHPDRRARRGLPGRAGTGQPARARSPASPPRRSPACRPSWPASSPTRRSCSLTGTYSAPAGGIALAVLMLPTVVLTAEEAIKAVPKITRDAAYGMGCTRSQVVWKVLLPTAMPGILTGVMLAVARAAGETAPLLFTALFSSYWLFEGGQPQLMQPTATLAVLIYNFSGMPFENQIELAWAASLVLVLMVLIINVVSRLVGQRRA